ncbi:hypothetical protein [Niabella hirudinis]|uniref:hypothetical protein n=1 Tax=Niabella hirudinis TaxID=1285929 RepID=UPI003EB87C79
MAGSAIFAAFMTGLLQYIVAGFLMLVIVFAAFSPDIVRMYEKSVKTKDMALAADAGMDKNTCEIWELLPEQEFIHNDSCAELIPGASFVKTFGTFRQPYVHPLHSPIPTPPPRPAV